MKQLNMVQALNQALFQEFEKNSNLVLLGEDVGVLGGVFRVTSGLHKQFGDERVLDTPLAELGIIGFGIGMAQKGLKPICEIQFADYIFPAYDQIINEMAKMRYRTGNEYSAPLLIRTPYGGGVRGGHYHSQSPEALFLHIPGIQVIVPSGPYDAKGLLISAMRADDPILFLEPKRIYRTVKENVPQESYTIPIGQAEVAKSGQDITLIGWGAQHHQNLKAAQSVWNSHQIDVEVLNLRTLNPLDIDTISQSVKKTGRCVIAHEAPKQQGFGAELLSQIVENCFLYLRSSIKRCCGLDTPFPRSLEKEYLPDAYKVIQSVIEVMES